YKYLLSSTGGGFAEKVLRLVPGGAARLALGLALGRRPPTAFMVGSRIWVHTRAFSFRRLSLLHAHESSVVTTSNAAKSGTCACHRGIPIRQRALKMLGYSPISRSTYPCTNIILAVAVRLGAECGAWPNPR